MSKRKTIHEFIKEAVLVHGNRYDYSISEYCSRLTKLQIICSEHGVFRQTPNDHLRGRGCAECGYRVPAKARLLNTEIFIKRARKVHGYRYTYKKSEYCGYHSNLTITCSIHGDFQQTPANHISGKHCKKCANELNKDSK